MRELTVFEHLSLDGYFVDAGGGMAWAKVGTEDPEWNTFVAGNAGGSGELLFGRVTYQMMASYWPTPMARQQAAEVAQGMNAMPKVVFSRTLGEASWSNTRLIKEDAVAAVRAMKDASGPGMVVLGSGSIVQQLAAADLVDRYQLVINPVALGEGRTPFARLPAPLRLRRTESRAFANGNVVLTYEPES